MREAKTVLAIETQSLRKFYGRKRGIEDVSLAVRAGEVFGFLGPNGAGKTTTIRLLLGFMGPTAGGGKVFGLDIVRDSLAIRSRVGYLPSEANLYPHFRGREIVEFALAARGRRDCGRVTSLRDRLEIDLSLTVKQCSRGMRQKVAIVAALAADTEMYILDEPTTGLDPLVRHCVADLLREEAARGKTIFLSSHNLAEVESLCGRVAIIREGRLAAVDEVSTLRGVRVKRVSARFAGAAPELGDVAGVRRADRDGDWLTLQVSGDLRPLLAVLAGVDLLDLRVEDPTLEEVFLAHYNSHNHHDHAPLGGETR
jgi:ABC-2 type transport system ATP-binding protein